MTEEGRRRRGGKEREGGRRKRHVTSIPTRGSRPEGKIYELYIAQTTSLMQSNQCHFLSSVIYATFTHLETILRESDERGSLPAHGCDLPSAATTASSAAKPRF